MVGTDEAFFEDDDNQTTLQDLNNPKLEKIIPALPPVVHSTKEFSTQGALVYMDTPDGNDAMAWVNEKGEIISESLSRFPHLSKYFRLSSQYPHQIAVVNGKKTGSDINLLFNETQMTGLFGFENRKAIFEGVHRSFKFVVLSFQKGGKTTEFPAAFMRHDVNELAKFPKRDALRVKTDLIYRLSPDSHSVMEFKSEMDVSIAEKMLQFPLLGEKIEGVWNLALTCEFNANTLTCLNEEIINETSGEILFKVANRSYQIGNNPQKAIEFKYQGSLLSVLQDEVLTTELINIRDFIISVKSTDLLSPQMMRKRAKQADNDLGLGGEKLSAFLHDLSADKKSELNKLIKNKFIPTFESVETSTIQAGWKKLSVIEQVDSEPQICTEAKHVSDGLLRLLAILSQMMTNHKILLFDEIEDGINPEIVEQLVDVLISTPQQIIITTHSPILLNYIEDEQAKQSVIFTYKNQKGITQQCQLFSIESLGEMLDSLAAGEAMVDLNLKS